MNPIRWLVDFFGFSQHEANGVVVLFVLIFALGIVPRLSVFQKKPYDASADSVLLETWYQSIKAAEEAEEQPDFKEYSKIQVRADLAKNKWSNRPAKTKPKEANEPKIAAPVAKSDLNSATAEHLQELPGIGPVLSDRIVRFRDRLGGFHDIRQLYEVYGLDSSVVDRVTSRFEVASAHRKTIFINTDSLNWLTRHPYLGYKYGKRIFYYRKTHGDFTSPEQLLAIKDFGDSLYHKIYPYISILPAEAP